VTKGFLEGVGLVAALVVLTSATALVGDLAHPSAALFRDLMQVGIGILIAFAVATAGVRVRDRRKLSQHLNWIGYSCGLGVTGLIAIVASVGLAAYREAGHAGALDIVGLCWIAMSLLLMGALVAALPYAVYSWSDSGPADRP
jgi:hypothetical protein